MRRRGRDCRLAVGRAEEAEEVRFWADHHARIAWFQPRLIGLHRAIEGEKIGILAIGLSEDAVSFRIAFASGLVGLLLRVATQDDDIAIGLGGDLLRLFGPLRAIFRRFARAFALHPAEDFFRDLLRQVRAADSHVGGGYPKPAALLVHLIADLQHQVGAIVPHDFRHVRFAQHAPDRRVQNEAELTIRSLDGADGLIESQRIDDPVAQEGVDIEPVVVRGQHLLLGRLDVENAIVEEDDVFDERKFDVKPRLCDEAAPGAPARRSARQGPVRSAAP